MSFHSTAQMNVGEILVSEELPEESSFHDHENHVLVYPELPTEEVVLEMHDPENCLESEEITEDSRMEDPSDLSSAEEPEIVVEELPGVGSLNPELETMLEVKEEDDSEAKDKEVKKSKKPEKWDWESKGAQGFVVWVKERVDSVPKHSGYDTAGIERAISYLDKLDSEISKAMRLDLEGDLDADKVEEIRSQIEDGIERLHDRLDKVSKKRKKKKASEQVSLVKEAQKAPRIAGLVITVPLLISRIARVCINGVVSAGHDLEDLFEKQCKQYKLNDREKAELMQFLADCGYPIRQDRGYLAGEEVDMASSDNYDWSSQYNA